MAFDYIDLESAKETDGLRMVVVRGVPSPWSESAKGVLHVKGLDWRAVSHAPGDAALRGWTHRDNAPVLVTETEERRSGWADILLHAEALQPDPGLIPDDPEDRAVMLGLAHELLGEGGLCWSRRLQIVAVGMRLEGASRKHAEYIGGKYGYDERGIKTASDRVVRLLTMFAGRLSVRGDGPYYFGAQLTALDIFSAAAMALFAPLAEDTCPMSPTVRAGFMYLDPATKSALAPQLLTHRDMMYDRHLETPLNL